MPELGGGDVLARRRVAQTDFDQVRRALMWEPRGHADMYGGWVGPAVRPDSDLSVLFLHNSGFSTMCGHGIVALTKVVLDTGVIPTNEPTTTLKIDTPAGQVTALAAVVDGTVTRVAFRNVASFVAQLEASVDVPGYGTVEYDLAFGGAYYAYVDAASLGLSLSETSSLIAAGRAIKQTLSETRPIEHAGSEDLGFLYGVIFTGEPEDPNNHHRSVCIFADGQVDRSPTGTGVSGRLAILHATGEVAVGESIRVESIVGSVFTGTVVEETSAEGNPAVIPEITGEAHIVGRSELWVDPGDPLSDGFLLR